jgi:hypothetical protein
MKHSATATVLVPVLCAGSAGRAAVRTLADSSGEVVGWGLSFVDQATVPGRTFIAMVTGLSHRLRIKRDGTFAGRPLVGDSH